MTDAPPEPLRVLVDDYRSRCLWFLREDYYPESSSEVLDVLGHVERNGDLEAFRRVAAMRRWLSQTTSAASAG